MAEQVGERKDLWNMFDNEFVRTTDGQILHGPKLVKVVEYGESLITVEYKEGDKYEVRAKDFPSAIQTD